MEKIDIPQTYLEIDDAIKKDEHERVLLLSEKILKADPKEKEAMQCKVISLINKSKYDEVISFIEKNALQKDYLIEYAYSLHEKKKYQESIDILIKMSSSRKDIATNINELLAQNFYKMGKYQDSFKLYKEIVEAKLKTSANDLNEEKDLLSNFLASYILSNANEPNLLIGLTKYLNSWESFYNYCLISIKEGKFNESMETLYRMNKDYPKLEEDLQGPSTNLNLFLIQNTFDGFDFTKFSNVIEEYDKYFSKNKSQDLYPYFYNNLIHAKKDKESLNEILRKFDTFLKSDDLNKEEKNVFLLNKIILLLRANRTTEAFDLYKTLTPSYNDPRYVVIFCYIYFKQEKIEKLEEMIKSDMVLNKKPEAYLIVIQLLLSSITSKNIEQFQIKVINFVRQFFEFTLNFQFLNFFIGFYESRHLKDYLKEFISNYNEPMILAKKMEDVKRCFHLLCKTLYSVGLYEESAKFSQYCLENFDKNNLDYKLNFINSVAHLDVNKSDEVRRQIDDTMIDLGVDHINNLLNEVFVKFKKNQGDKANKKKTKKKKEKRYPKNFDPKKPGPMPDPERWIPKLQRKKYKNINKNKMAYQGAQTDTTTTTSKFGKK